MLRNAFDTKTTKLFLFKKSKQNKQTKIAKTAKKKNKQKQEPCYSWNIKQ